MAYPNLCVDSRRPLDSGRMPWPYLNALNQVRSKSEGPELAASGGG
jgi:hypothetical protein